MNIDSQFNEVFREAVQNERNITRLDKYKENRIVAFNKRMEQAEKIIRERMDGATLDELNDALTRASRVLFNSGATPQTAAIVAIGDWPQGPETA